MQVLLYIHFDASLNIAMVCLGRPFCTTAGKLGSLVFSNWPHWIAVVWLSGHIGIFISSMGKGFKYGYYGLLSIGDDELHIAHFNLIVCPTALYSAACEEGDCFNSAVGVVEQPGCCVSVGVWIVEWSMYNMPAGIYHKGHMVVEWVLWEGEANSVWCRLVVLATVAPFKVPLHHPCQSSSHY